MLARPLPPSLRDHSLAGGNTHTGVGGDHRDHQPMRLSSGASALLGGEEDRQQSRGHWQLPCHCESGSSASDECWDVTQDPAAAEHEPLDLWTGANKFPQLLCW